MITVITRTSNRPNFFAECRRSVLAQTRPAFHLVLSDDPTDTYPDGDLVVPLWVRQEGRGTNSYFNWILPHIPDEHPWVIFLDDDDQFMALDAIESIENAIERTSEDCLFMWQVQFPGNRLVPGAAFGQPPMPGNITGIGFCYHKKHWVDWPPYDFADYMVISQLYMRLVAAWIDAVFTGMQVGPGMGHRLDLPEEIAKAV